MPTKPETPSESVKSSTKSIVSPINDKTNEKFHTSAGGKGGNVVKNVTVSIGSKVNSVAKTEIKTKIETHRDSIDEAIEATITRYSANEPRTVIVTPKKRHRMEMERKINSLPVVKSLTCKLESCNTVTTPQPNKRAGSRSSSTNNQSVQRSSSPSPVALSQPSKRVCSRSVSITKSNDANVQATSNSIVPRKRSGSRSSNVSTHTESSTTVTATTTPQPIKRAVTRSIDTVVPQISSTSAAIPVIILPKRVSRASNHLDASILSPTTAPTVPVPTVLSKRIAARVAAANQTETNLEDKPLSKRIPTRISTSNSENQLPSMEDKTNKRQVPPRLTPNQMLTTNSDDKLNKRQLHPRLVAHTDQNTIESPLKPLLQHVGSLSTRSAAKTFSTTPLITPIPPPTENTLPKSPRSKTGNKPPAGVFEPSSKSDELMNIVAMPTSPIKCVAAAVLNKLSDRLKGYEKEPDLFDKPIVKVDESHNGRNRPKRLNESLGEEERKMKKRKVIRDIRVHVTKLSPSDLILKKVMDTVKTKVRRRKAINRTGFPVKKKKKKRPLEPLNLVQNCENVIPNLVIEDLTKVKMSPVLTTTIEKGLEKAQETKVKVEDIVDSEKPSKKKIELIKTEKVQKAESIGQQYKLELRKSSRRLMELRKRTEAMKRRKRKHNGSLSRARITSRDRSPVSVNEVPVHSTVETTQPELRLHPLKRLRKTREEVLDREDRYVDINKICFL